MARLGSATLVWFTTAVLSPSAMALPEQEARLELDKVLSGERFGGVERLVVSKSVGDRLADRLKLSPREDRYVIDRWNDPDQQACLERLGAGWMRDMALAVVPGGGIASATLEATGWSGVPDCNREWHEKLYQVAVADKFQVLEATINENDKTVREYVDLIFQSISSEVTNVKIGQETLKVETKNSLKALQAQMKKLASEHKSLADAVIAERKRAEALVEVQRRRDNVEASYQVVRLLSRVAFKDQPTAQYRITTGARSIATIADSVVRLRGDGLQTGAKVLLSMNIANAAFSMAGMFGPMGRDPTAAMIEEGFKSVRSDIRSLRREMNDRFDRVDEALKIIASTMDDRFNRLDKQFDKLADSINDLKEDQKRAYRVSKATFEELLQKDFADAYDYCTNALAEEYLELDSFTRCLIAVKAYGTRVASNEVVTGAALFQPTLRPEDAAMQLQALPPELFPGFLNSSLVYGVGGPGAAIPALRTPVPSVKAWSASVDLYLQIRSMGPKLKKMRVDPLTPSRLALLTTPHIDELRASGIQALSSVGALRREGVQAAAAIYRRYADAFVTDLVGSTMQALIEEDLGIVDGGVDFRDHVNGYVHINGWQRVRMELRRGTQYVVKEGPDRGKSVIFNSYVIRLMPLMIDLQQGGGVEKYAEQLAVEALVNDAAYPVNTYVHGSKTTSAEELRKALVPFHGRYLSDVPYSKLNDATRSLLTKALTKAGRTAAMQQRCMGLATAKLYMLQLAMLYRTESAANGRWTTAALNIPGSPDASQEQICDAAIDMLVKFPRRQDDQPMAKYIEGRARELFEVQLNTFLKLYESVDANTDVPEVEFRLKVLESILVQNRPDGAAADQANQ